MDTGQINLAPCYFIAHAPQTGDLIDYIGILKTRELKAWIKYQIVTKNPIYVYKLYMKCNTNNNFKT